MSFAQSTWRDSLRDIEVSLSTNPSKLYALGFCSPIKRSTLADALRQTATPTWATCRTNVSATTSPMRTGTALPIKRPSGANWTGTSSGTKR